MFRNYLKIAIRNLWKNKGFSAINIMGLAIGIATCLLISLYVLHELSYDRYHEKQDRIYRVNTDLKFGGAEQKFAVSPDPLAFTMVDLYPEVENAVRFRGYGSSVVKKGDRNIKEERIISVDSTLFEVFSLPMIAGNSKTALVAPQSVVITEKIAIKYFNRTDVVGESLRFDNSTDYKITGVIRDMPENSHFNFDFFVSLSGSEESRRGMWLSFNFNTYLLLKKGTNSETVEARFADIFKKFMWPQAKEVLNIQEDDFYKSGNYIRMSLMPVTDIHLRSDRIAELAPNSDIQMVYIFTIIAVLILLIACVNFMNLSTARSANRAKEVGVRKVLGSQRLNLINQFLTESVMMSLTSFFIAMLLAFLLLPYFNQLAVKQLSLSPYQHPVLLPVLLGFAIVVGLLAGSYPAFYLSSFQPIEVLKGKLSRGFRSSYFRSGLVVLQFFISIGLIVATIVIYRQLNYIQSKKLGFNKEHVVTIHDTYVLNNNIQTFKNEVLKQTGVVSGTISSYLPVPSGRNDNSFFPEGEILNEKAVSMQSWGVDHDYIPTLGMEIVKGRNFSKEFLTDSGGVILNESAVRLFGYPDPIGKKITTYADLTTKALISYTVIGVVKNFHFESLRQNVGALCLILNPSTGLTSFRINTTNPESTLRTIENIWKKMAPGESFTYTFMNEDFNNVYRAEQRVARIFISFAVFAIFIACLGLFGLATYAAEQRTKEIGIRKVLGATAGNVVTMLSKDFVKLVVIAALFAFPISWWAMHKWLEDFAYRINIGWWVFFVAGVIALLIALITVSFQAVKAAVTNPVKSLRTE